MSEIILLGAGASKDAKLPDSFGMTQAIIEEFHKRSDYRQYLSIANYVLGGLFFEEGRKGKNPIKYNINVEDFFNAILLLAERDNLEVTPFINSWHPMVEELDKVTSSSDKLANSLKKMIDDITQILSSKNEPPGNESFSNFGNKDISALTLGNYHLTSYDPITSHYNTYGRGDSLINTDYYVTPHIANIFDFNKTQELRLKKKSPDYSQLEIFFRMQFGRLNLSQARAKCIDL